MAASIKTLIGGVQRGMGSYAPIIKEFDAVLSDPQSSLVNVGEVIEKDPDLVRRFLKGWFTIAAYMRDHRAETVKLAAATMKLSEKVIDETYGIETGMMSFDGQFDPQVELEPVSKQVRRYAEERRML